MADEPVLPVTTLINLNAANVEVVDATLQQAQEGSVDDIPGVTEALDKAQAKVFLGNAFESYLVIRVLKT